MTLDIAKDMILQELNHENWRPSVIQLILDDCSGVNTDTDKIIQIASSCANADYHNVIDGRRFGECVTARAMVYKYLRESGATLMAIGRRFNKDHATVKFSIDNFNGLLSVNDDIATKCYNKFISILSEEE